MVVKFGKGNKTTMSLRSCGGGWFRYYSHCHNVFPVSAFVSSSLTPIGCCLCRLTGFFGCCSSLHDTGWPWFGRHACIEVRAAQPFLATENRKTKTMNFMAWRTIQKTFLLSSNHHPVRIPETACRFCLLLKFCWYFRGEGLKENINPFGMEEEVF